MTFSTETRVASRTLAAPLITRETVPTPTPDAAATSAIVARRDDDIVTLPTWNRFHLEVLLALGASQAAGTIQLGHVMTSTTSSSRLGAGYPALSYPCLTFCHICPRAGFREGIEIGRASCRERV